MITDEEFDAIVDSYCRKIKKICDETVYVNTALEVVKNAREINKLVARIEEIKSIRKAQKGEE